MRKWHCVRTPLPVTRHRAHKAAYMMMVTQHLSLPHCCPPIPLRLQALTTLHPPMTPAFLILPAASQKYVSSSASSSSTRVKRFFFFFFFYLFHHVTMCGPISLRIFELWPLSHVTMCGPISLRIQLWPPLSVKSRVTTAEW